MHGTLKEISSYWKYVAEVGLRGIAFRNAYHAIRPVTCENAAANHSTIDRDTSVAWFLVHYNIDKQDNAVRATFPWQLTLLPCLHR